MAPQSRPSGPWSVPWFQVVARPQGWESKKRATTEPRWLAYVWVLQQMLNSGRRTGLSARCTGGPELAGGAGTRAHWSVTRNPATIDVDDFASDERRRLEEEETLDDVTYLADVTNRLARSEQFVLLGRVYGRLNDA